MQVFSESSPTAPLLNCAGGSNVQVVSAIGTILAHWAAPPLLQVGVCCYGSATDLAVLANDNIVVAVGGNFFSSFQETMKVDLYDRTGILLRRSTGIQFQPLLRQDFSKRWQDSGN